MLAYILVITSLSGGPVPTLSHSIMRSPSYKSCQAEGPRVVNSIINQYGRFDKLYRDLPDVSFECVEDVVKAR